jgi:hypothetical protein
LLTNTLLNNFRSLTLDSNGICVIKKLVNTNKSEKIKLRIIEELKLNTLEFVQSPFGNYAIQHVFQEYGFKNCKCIVDIIMSNIVSLSMQKYSSNVVEKCLELSEKVIKVFIYRLYEITL